MWLKKEKNKFNMQKMNKKGQFNLIGLGIGIIIALALILLFLFSEKYRLIIGGVALLGLGIWAVLKYGSKRTKTFAILTMFIGGLLLIFVFPQFTQSVLALSNIQVEDGKAYYTWYASANQPGEQYTFTYTPRTYTEGDLTITPKDSLVIAINPGEPICTYQTTKQTKDIRYLGIKVGTFTYYTLGNPAKSIDVKIADAKTNKEYTLDGTSVSSLTIKDSDGDGSLVVQTQGLLSGKYNCPDNDNVAIAVKKDGTYDYVYKNDLDNFISSLNSWSLTTAYSNLRNVDLNTGFTSSFEETVKFDGDEVSGIINFGYPTFTITADSDYFDATYYTQPKLPEPKIGTINLANEVKADGSSSGSVLIKNNGDEGLVYLKIDSDDFSIGSYSSNFNLDNEKTIYFTIKAPNSELCGDIYFEVCSTSQFTSSSCDSNTAKLCSVMDQKDVSEYCGDGICQSNENFNTCQSDCKQIIDDNNGELSCKWYQEEKTINEVDRTWYNYFGIGNPEIITSRQCRTAEWIYIVVASSIILILGLSFILTSPKSSKKRKI